MLGDTSGALDEPEDEVEEKDWLEEEMAGNDEQADAGADGKVRQFLNFRLVKLERQM